MNTLKYLGCLCSAVAGLAFATIASAGSVSTSISCPTAYRLDDPTVWFPRSTVFTCTISGSGSDSGDSIALNRGQGGGNGGSGVHFHNSWTSILQPANGYMVLYRYCSTGVHGGQMTATIQYNNTPVEDSPKRAVGIVDKRFVQSPC